MAIVFIVSLPVDGQIEQSAGSDAGELECGRAGHEGRHQAQRDVLQLGQEVR